MSCFYNAVLESLIRYGMAAWYGSLSILCKTKISKLVQNAMKIIGNTKYPSLQSIFETSVLAQADKITKEPSHALFSEYKLLPSGRRYRAVRCEYARYKESFIPVSVALLNKRK